MKELFLLGIITVFIAVAVNPIYAPSSPEIPSAEYCPDCQIGGETWVRIMDEKKSYSFGDKIIITGESDNDDHTIDIEVTDKMDNVLVNKETTIIDEKINFEFSVNDLPKNSADGVYKIKFYIGSSPYPYVRSFDFVKGDSSQMQTLQADKSEGIPDWVKNNAKWWSEGGIDDNAFVSGIQFLIKEGIIQVDTSKAGEKESDGIPDWVKNNAKWWSEGGIDDNAFLNGISFLVENGIIKV